MCCAALVWAMPEKGDDLYERFQGCRRPGTNRLVGGGWPLQVHCLPQAMLCLPSSLRSACNGCGGSASAMLGDLQLP